MVVIRLSRVGRKKSPFYHIIVTNKQTKRDRFIEKIGYFDPIKKTMFAINWERYQYWKDHGAQISPNSRVNVLVRQWTEQNKNAPAANETS